MYAFKLTIFIHVTLKVLRFLLFHILVRVLFSKKFCLCVTAVGLCVEFPIHVQAKRPRKRRKQTAKQEKFVPVHFEQPSRNKIHLNFK